MKLLKLHDFLNFNPRESIKKRSIAKKIPMEKLLPYKRRVEGFEVAEFNGGAKFRNGDTLLARITPCLENGKTAQINCLDENEVGFGSTEFIVLRAIENISDPNFVYYLSISPNFREIAIKSMVGSSGRQRVQQDVLENLELQLPPLEEQKKIASVLSAFDDKIEVNNKINQNLEAQAQAIFKSWFVDFEPFGGKIPSTWEYGNLKEVSEKIICGKTPPTTRKEYYGKDIPFITIPDMHNNTFIVKTSKSLSKFGAQSQNSKTLPKNTICVSCIATAGLVSIVSCDSQTNQQINSVIPKNTTLTYYIYLTMKSLSDTIKKLGAGGSTVTNLNKTQFEKIAVMIPTKGILEKFDKIVDPIFKKIYSNQKENIILAQLRDTLLPKLMSGEIDISNLAV